MARTRLRNRPLTTKEAQIVAAADLESNAREAAKEALQHWYQIGYDKANIAIRKMQVDSNDIWTTTTPSI